MGAVTFSLDVELVTLLKTSLPLDVLVETGTFKGDTVAELETSFEKVISIELSEKLCTEAKKRFVGFNHVRVIQGNSAVELFELKDELHNIGVLYWLDAHWCVATDTAGELSQCPLLEELQAIGRLNSDSVLLIDDARLFLAPPLAPHEISQWPSFHQIVSSLLFMSSEHEVMVINDVIAFFPKKTKGAMESFAQKNGTDWLIAFNCQKENGNFIQQLVEKETVIQGRIKVIEEREKVIQELEKIVQDQCRALRNYNRVLTLIRPLLPVLLVFRNSVRRCISILRPRLGNLNQYAPRPLTPSTNLINLHQLKNTPKVSIVTPSFKQADFIERTIKSVLDQQYPNLEYFIQDGGSEDGTTAVLKRYEEKLAGWSSEKDNGQSQAINLGFAKTNGEIMAWLNSDDLLLPGAIAVVVNYFNSHPEVDVVYGNRLLVDKNDKEIGRWILPGHDDDVLSWADYVPQETMFWRRNIWDKAGSQIDESFRFAMDWDLLVRFREAGAKFAHIRHFLGAFRIHEQQKTSAVINEIGQQEMDRIRGRVLGEVPTRKEIHKNVLPFMLKHIIIDLCFRVKCKFSKS